MTSDAIARCCVFFFAFCRDNSAVEAPPLILQLSYQTPASTNLVPDMSAEALVKSLGFSFIAHGG
jgi:hypothetical protein